MSVKIGTRVAALRVPLPPVFGRSTPMSATAPNAPTMPLFHDGQPIWHAPRALRDYLTRLGGNTG